MDLSAAETFAVRELLASYCHAIDSGTPDDFAAVFTSDGSWRGPGGEYRGREQLRGMAAAYRQHPDVANSRHWTANTTSHRSGETIEADSYSLCLGEGPGGTVVVELIGRYLDVIVKEDDLWRIQDRQVLDVWPREVSEFQLETS